MIEFRPRADYNGAAGFEYTISDGRGGFDTAYVSITVMPRNDGPILRNDLVTGLEDKPLYVIPGEAFGNDIDARRRRDLLQALDRARRADHKFLSPDYEVVAKLGNNRDLPDWLSFDAATMSFSGTLPEGRAEVEVVIFIRDPNNGATHPHRFSFDAEELAEGASLRGEVMAGYIDPRRASPSASSSAPHGSATASTVTASLADGRRLPDWL